MLFKNLTTKEEGYLLLESLFTLAIIMVVITVMCPLTVDWLNKHQTAKRAVEENRQLYEHSMNLTTSTVNAPVSEGYTIQIEADRMRIEETGTEVILYEKTFTAE